MRHLTLQEQTSMILDGWHIIDKLYEEYAKSLGLTYIGLSVLNAIYGMPENCTQKAICERTHLPKQSVNGIIRSLWEQGYVKMKETDSDRRNKIIRFSKSGRDYADRTIGRLLKKEEKVVAQLTYRERQIMIGFLEKTGNSIEECIQAGQSGRKVLKEV
ncbi:MarR family transcriptional regulator [Brucepastera parasyntrophica]|uniref:MarR family winged helix-turn-helix transcriptional regulator n=1 Tax=Brucepastera parasyntrophica TaxID=2880008 RepID=UPI002109E7A0|nr:helix-turn-helix domain-containing protein [Brucepastera parasyntrophica]ULQ60437.1 MarR family transcriptional regulator [Brucepastera parasyntrophica]